MKAKKTKVQKLMSLLIAFLMLMSMTLPANAAVISDEAVGAKTDIAQTGELLTGSCGENGDNATYSFDTETGVLTVTGTGNMAHYNETTQPWVDFKSDITTLVIDSGVTRVGDYAFYNCTNLKQVTLADTITRVHYHAFENCTSLETISFPESVSNIDEYSFNNCTSLKNAYVHNSSANFLSYVFDGANEEFTIHGYDGSTAQIYAEGNGINFVSLSETPTEESTEGGLIKTGRCLDDATYTYNTATGLLTISGTGALNEVIDLSDDYVTKIVINEGITSIGQKCFYSYSALQEVVIPSTVTSIGTVAFSGCENLTKIIIPNGVTNIGDNAFSHCTRAKTISISSSVTSIGNSAFYGCDSVENVEIPSSVTSIGNTAFGYCDSLKSAYINNKDLLFGINIFKGNASDFKIYGYTGSTAQTYADDYNHLFEDIESIFRGQCGDNAYYNLNLNSGELKITGTGNMYNYTYDNTAPWFSKRSSIKSVIIESGITGIGDYAFSSCKNLKSVNIPTSVNNIGNNAFNNCSSIESIIIPEGVTKLNYFTFNKCTSLKNVTLPQTLTAIEYSAFNGCTGLTEVSIPKTVQGIGNNAFNTCSALKSITIPEGITAIEDYTFKSCTSLTTVTLPSTIKTIGSYAFSGCSSLTKVSLPSSITSISNNAFNSCSGLESITIPESVSKIEMYTFKGCSKLKTINLSKTLESIENNAFYNCSSLETIIIPENVTGIGDNAFGKCTTLTKAYIYSKNVNFGSTVFNGKTTDLTIYGYYASTSQTYANDNNHSFEYLGGIVTGQCGDNAYYSLDLSTGEMSITGFGDMYDHYSSGDNPPWLSYKKNIKTVTFEDAITKVSNNAFSNCVNLTQVNLPSSLETIGYYAFSQCGKLKDIIIPENVGIIYSFAFFQSGLTEVTIPASVWSLQSSSFAACENLTKIIVDENNEYNCSVDGVLFDKSKSELKTYPCNKTGNTYTVPDSVEEVGDYAFAYNKNLTSVTVPTSVKNIEYQAFHDTQNLSDIFIYNFNASIYNLSTDNKVFTDTTTLHGYNNSTTNVYATEKNLKFESLGDYIITGQCGDNAYYSMNLSTEELKITGSGSMYRYDATYGNESPWSEYKEKITSLIFDDEISYIGNDAFRYCSNLITVKLPSSLTSIGTYAFSQCGFTNIDLPNSLITIGSNAFYECPNLKSIVIPGNVTTIEDSVFYGCASLVNVELSASVTLVPSSAFSYCLSLESVNVDENNEAYCSVDGILFDKQKATLVTYPAGKQGTEYTIPSTVRVIDFNAFSFNKNLTRINIPANVNQIKTYAIYNTSSLTDLYIYNPVVELFGNYSISSNSNLTIYGYNDSTAQTYAANNKINFVSLGESPYELIKVHLKHTTQTQTMWTPYVWAWYVKDSVSSNVSASWPGEAAVSGENDWYDFSFLVLKDSTYSFIVSDNANPQTADYTGYSSSQNELWIAINDNDIVNEGKWLSVFENKADADNYLSEFNVYGLYSALGDNPADPAANILTNNGDGTYSITYDNVPAGNYNLFVLENLSYSLYYSANIGVLANARVTVTYDKATNEVTADVVYYEWIIHAKVAPSWNSVPYIQYWVDGEETVEAPGVKMVADEGGWYTYTISGINKHFNINNGGNGKETNDILIEHPEYWIICDEAGGTIRAYGYNPGNDETITINFNTNGGTDFDSVTGDIYSGVTIPTDVPTKYNASFHIWGKRTNGGINFYKPGQKYYLPGELNLEAVWKTESTYRIYVKTQSHVPYIYYQGAYRTPLGNYFTGMIDNGDGTYYCDVPGDCPFVQFACEDSTYGFKKSNFTIINLPSQPIVTIDDNITETTDILTFEIEYRNGLNFVTNGGSVTPNFYFDRSLTITKDNLPMPTKNGYIFTGWFTDEACKNALKAGSAISESVTLFAGWQEIGEVTIGADDPTSSLDTANAFELFGAQIRLQPNMGLRFCTRVSTKMLDSLKEATGNDAQYGHVLAFKDSIADDSNFVVGATTTSGKTVKERMSEYNYYVSDDYVVYTACILNIPLESYKKEIAARPFIKYTDANGVLRYHYFTETGSKNIGGAYYTSLYYFASYVYGNGFESEDYRNTLYNDIILKYELYIDNLNKGENEREEPEL